MRPGQTIEIQLVAKNGEPLPFNNVLVEINFFMNGRFRFAFNIGKTTAEGNLIVSYDRIESLRQQDAQFNLMDYNSKLEECDPLVEIKLLSEEGLLEREKYVLKVFKRAPDWAEPWPSNSRVKALPEPVELTQKITRVQIPCETLS